jgi:beta-aspartyl-peptidase (threonine type)
MKTNKFINSILRLSVIFILFVFFASTVQFGQGEENDKVFGLALHGGAGTIKKSSMTQEKEKAYRKKLREAIEAGYKILKNNGSSLDAVEASIRILEDSPLFNAGKGSVFTSEGVNEMDASIMDGKTRNAGAISGVKRIKNPISLARKVMDNSKHVMLTGKGAEQFAKELGIDWVQEKYFFTERRWKSLQKIKEREKTLKKKTSQAGGISDRKYKYGTVGCVALDKYGNLAAGTSTGGMTNKEFGRVGDSPIIGAGTYANNGTCAVSSTGHGEFFIRWVVAYDIAALMEYKGLSLKKAAEQVVMTKLKEAGGSGGIIAIDNRGNIAMPFNTEGMYRAYSTKDGKFVIKLYKD